MIGKETAAIVLVEQAVEAPLLILQGANIQNVHHHQVTWLGTFYANRAAQVMHLQQVYVTDVIGAVVVANLTTSPIHTLDAELVTGLDHGHHGRSGCQRLWI